MSCVVCGAASERPKLRKGEVEIVECPECGLAWWKPPSDFRPESVYGADYFDGAGAGPGYDDYANLEASLRRTFATRLRALPPPRAGARLLDVGAAYGYAVAEAVRGGWSAFGLEVSRAAARRAAVAAPGRVVVARGASLPFGARSFDAVTLWDVLEHLPDPNAALGEIAQLLRPGGRLALSTGDVGSLAARLSGARWHLYTLPEHLFFYTRASLRRLLERHGFAVEGMRAEGASYTVGYLVERLRKSLLGRGAERAARWPGSGLRVPLNLFDIVTVHALRRGA